MTRATATVSGAVVHMHPEMMAAGRRMIALPPATDLPVADAAVVHLRQLRYFRDLLALGVESTIWPDRSARTLRHERIALGIDLAELDAVALWSVRRGDGTLEIPFADFILARAHEAGAWFESWDRDGALRRCLGRLEHALAAVAPPGQAAPALPRLEGVHLVEGLVAGLFGADGTLDRLVDVCETLLPDAGRGVATEAY